MRGTLVGEPVYCPACRDAGTPDELIAERRPVAEGAFLIVVKHAKRVHVDPRSTTCSRGHCTTFGAYGEAITPAAVTTVLQAGNNGLV